MTGVKLGLCCSRPPGSLMGLAESSLENAVQFFRIGAGSLGEPLTLARLDGSAAYLEESLREAAENDVTHVLFLSPRTLLPFYSIQRLIEMDVNAVSGVSWTWMAGPEVFPRLGYFDPEGRPYPYFGWSAPDLFEVDWCGLDCLLLSRPAIEEIAEPLKWIQGREPALRISQCLRSVGIRILVDSSVQCPRMIALPLRSPRSRQRFIPSPDTWREFSRDFTGRRIPRGPVYDPAYRGRSWYRSWVADVFEP